LSVLSLVLQISLGLVLLESTLLVKLISDLVDESF